MENSGAKSQCFMHGVVFLLLHANPVALALVGTFTVGTFPILSRIRNTYYAVFD